ncbi:hypothetical protein [Streptomyces rimosus]|uniref:hypothetical protein n=1 Tax=Streptomyces rimosus TaxID=1927 RepID=UPI000AA11D34|nr:hypothetical protein [Streptomyces rimosus]
MGRIKKQRGPRTRGRAQASSLGMVPAPGKVHWTPLEHSQCGCVVEWGWDTAALPPPVFMQWCRGVVRFACPWHGGEGSVPIPKPPSGESIALHDPGSGHTFYAQAADGQSAALGTRLSDQLNEIDCLIAQGTEAVLAAMPSKHRDWMIARGHDPVSTWLDQRFTDILLNTDANRSQKRCSPT